MSKKMRRIIQQMERISRLCTIRISPLEVIVLHSRNTKTNRLAAWTVTSLWMFSDKIRAQILCLSCVTFWRKRLRYFQINYQHHYITVKKVKGAIRDFSPLESAAEHSMETVKQRGFGVCQSYTQGGLGDSSDGRKMTKNEIKPREPILCFLISSDENSLLPL